MQKQLKLNNINVEFGELDILAVHPGKMLLNDESPFLDVLAAQGATKPRHQSALDGTISVLH